jgi:serum/glucocorticoid-regulated kinase 2
MTLNGKILQSKFIMTDRQIHSCHHSHPLIFSPSHVSIGCIAYEMMTGNPPFESRKGAKDLFRKIMNERVRMPDGASAAACVLLKGLLNRNATARFGAAKGTMFQVGGVTQVKQLAFFAKIDWGLLEQKKVEPPERLEIDNDLDVRHFYDE